MSRSLNGWRIAAVAVLAAGCLAGTAGCAAVADNRPPEETLSLAVSGLKAADRIGFEGRSSADAGNGLSGGVYTFSGEIVGHDTLKLAATHAAAAEQTAGDVERNPAVLLERIENAQKTVERQDDKRTGNAKSAVIHIRLADAPAKAMMEARLRGDFEQTVQAARKRLTPAGGAHAAAATAEAAAINREIERSRSELEQLLATLKVQADYRLEVDRTTMRPQSLSETAVLTYTAQGTGRREKRDTVYTFTAFGGG